MNRRNTSVNHIAEVAAPPRYISNKWRLERRLGRGGMSSVYQATHRNGHQVAVKVLHPELAHNPRMQTRFLREGYLANRVEHPGAVRVLDDGVDGSWVYLVMELLVGRDLEAVRLDNGGSLAYEEAVWVARQLCSILVSAHAVDVIHRDIKPTNLFLTSSGELKLLDFGVASLRGVPGFTTHADTAVSPGTPGFMSPEQVRGENRRLSASSDVWGVGATLFMLLTGRSVHLASTPGEMMISTATVPVCPVRSLDPKLPQALAHVVDKALALDPQARWLTAEDMLVALQDLEGLPPALGTEPASSGELDTWDPNSASDTEWTGRSDAPGRSSGDAPTACFPLVAARPGSKDVIPQGGTRRKQWLGFASFGLVTTLALSTWWGLHTRWSSDPFDQTVFSLAPPPTASAHAPLQRSSTSVYSSFPAAASSGQLGPYEEATGQEKPASNAPSAGVDGPPHKAADPNASPVGSKPRRGLTVRQSAPVPTRDLLRRRF